MAAALAVALTACSGPEAACSSSISVTLQGNDRALLDGQAVTQDEIVPAIVARYGDQKDCRVLVRADRAVVYGDVMKLMDAMQAAGYPKFMLVAEEVIAP